MIEHHFSLASQHFEGYACAWLQDVGRQFGLLEKYLGFELESLPSLENLLRFQREMENLEKPTVSRGLHKRVLMTKMPESEKKEALCYAERIENDWHFYEAVQNLQFPVQFQNGLSDVLYHHEEKRIHASFYSIGPTLSTFDHPRLSQFLTHKKLPYQLFPTFLEQGRLTILSYQTEPWAITIREEQKREPAKTTYYCSWKFAKENTEKRCVV